MREIGLKGEDIACQYLTQEKGYQLVLKNYYARVGEIDIIAKDQDILAFIEVKAYKPGAFLDPRLSITKSKQRKLKLTAQVYLTRNKIKDQQCRFDLVIVENNQVKEHLENII